MNKKICLSVMGVLLAFAIISMVSATNLSQGLISYYPFDGGIGDSVSSYGFTSINSISFTSGIIDVAVSVDNTGIPNSYLEGNPAGYLEVGTGDFTINLWFNTTDTGSDYAVLFGNGLQEGGGTTGFWIAINGGTVDARISQCEGCLIVSGDGYLDGNWHMATIKRDNGNFTLWLDGVLKGADESLTSASSDAGYWWVGASTSDGQKGITASIDELGFWNRSVSDDGIVNGLYNSGNARDLSSLFSYVEAEEEDTTPPSISIDYPLNTSYKKNVSQLNYTCTDGAFAWYSRDNGATNSTPVACGTNFTNVQSVEGSNTWTLYANDTLGNLNLTSITFFKDTIAPSVSLLFPLNLTYQFNVSQLNYTCIDGAFAWYSRDNGATNSTPIACGTNFTNVQSIDGGNTWILYTNDTLGNLIITQVSFTKYIPIEIGYVNVTLVSPSNQLNTTQKTLNFNANVIPTNVNLTNATLFIWDENGSLYQSAFTTLSGNTTQNAQFTRTLDLGIYEYNVFGCGYNKANASDLECNFAENNFTLIVRNIITESVVINETEATYNDVIFDVSNDNIAIYFNTPNETINLTFTNWTILDINSTIIFPQVNFVFLVGENATALNFNTTIFTGYNNITIFTDEFYQLNTTAHLIFTGLPFENPIILRNGVQCPEDICTNLVYDNGTAEFDVTGFSSYSLEETPEEVVIIEEGGLIQGSGLLYEVSASAGAGLGKFMQYLTIALPFLLLGLALVGVVILLASVLKEAFGKTFWKESLA